MGDSSDASFQRAFMDIPGLCSMKALYTPWVRMPISSSVEIYPAGDFVARRCGHGSHTMARRFPAGERGEPLQHGRMLFLSLHLGQSSLCLGQPERHVHGAVQVDGGS
jgi:hypothetical protein